MKLKKINLKIILKIFLVFLVITLIPLFFVNGPIWLLLFFIMWSIMISILWILFYKYISRKKKLVKKPIRFATIVFVIYLIIAPILLVFLTFQLITIPVSYVRAEFNRGELERIVNDVTKSCKTDEEKTRSILNWFDRYSGNIYNIWGKSQIGPFVNGGGDPFDWIICARTSNRQPALWVLTTRCGACEEHSVLFREMANEAGLTARSVVCLEVDHLWDEVKINGSWIIVDPSNVIHKKNMSGYNLSSQSFERTHAHRTKNISYVFAEYSNGSKEDITYRYTNLTHINITTIDENHNPVPYVEISIISYNKESDGKDTSYSSKTDKNGKYQLNIGGGDIKLISKTNGIIPLYNETRQRFYDDEFYDVTVVLKSYRTKNYLLVGFVIALPIFIVLSSYLWHRSKKKRRI